MTNRNDFELLENILLNNFGFINISKKENQKENLIFPKKKTKKTQYSY